MLGSCATIFLARRLKWLLLLTFVGVTAETRNRKWMLEIGGGAALRHIQPLIEVINSNSLPRVSVAFTMEHLPFADCEYVRCGGVARRSNTVSCSIRADANEILKFIVLRENLYENMCFFTIVTIKSGIGYEIGNNKFLRWCALNL